MQKLVALTIFISILRLFAAQCPRITVSDVEAALNVQLQLLGSEGGAEFTLQINEFNINCLAAASMKGYEQTTVTVNFTTSTNPTQSPVVQLNINCVGTEWDENNGDNEIILPHDSDYGGGVATAEELLAAEVDISCLRCHRVAAANSPSHCKRESEPQIIG